MGSDECTFASCCASFAGVVFDVINVLVALADQATDMYIIYTLFTDKADTTGAVPIRGLMLTFVCVASVLSTFAFMVRTKKWWRFSGSEWKLFAVFFGLLLISPLLPLWNFVLSVCWPDNFETVSEINWSRASKAFEAEDKNAAAAAAAARADDDMLSVAIAMPRPLNGEDDAIARELAQIDPTLARSGKDKADGAAAAAAGASPASARRSTASKDLFARLVAPQHESLALIDGAIARRVGSFSVFALVTAAESIPNAVLVLIYLSLNEGQVDWSTLLSLLLSLASIATKAFVIARSATIAAVVFKSLVVVFDTFLFAFLAASLFSSSAPRDHNLFGIATDVFNATGDNSTRSEPYMVSSFTAAFLYSKLIFWGICAVATIIAGMVIMYKETYCSGSSCKRRCETFGLYVLLTFAWCVCVLPVAIAQSAICLSWFVIAQAWTQPSSYDLPFVTSVHEFLWTETGDERPVDIDWAATIQKLTDDALRLHSSVAQLLADKDLRRRAIVQSVPKVPPSTLAGSAATTEPPNDDDDNTGTDDDDSDGDRADVTVARAIQRALDNGDDDDGTNNNGGGGDANPLRRHQRPRKDRAAAAAAAAAAEDDDSMEKWYNPRVFAEEIQTFLAIAGRDRFVHRQFAYNNVNQFWHAALLRYMVVRSRVADGDGNGGGNDDAGDAMMNTTTTTRVRYDTFSERLRHLAQISNFGYAMQHHAQVMQMLQTGPARGTGPPVGVNYITGARAGMPGITAASRNRRNPMQVSPVCDDDIKAFLDRNAAYARTNIAGRARNATNMDEDDEMSKMKYSSTSLPCSDCSCKRFCDCLPRCCKAMWGCGGQRCCGGIRAEEAVMIIVAVVSWMSSLFSLFTFILWPAVYGVANMTLLQLICLGIGWASLFLLLLLSRSFYRYCWSCMFFSGSSSVGSFGTLRDTFAQVVDTFYSIGTSLILRFVPSEVVPTDAFTQHVLLFLSPKSVDGLYGASPEDLKQLRRLLEEKPVKPASPATLRRMMTEPDAQ